MQIISGGRHIISFQLFQQLHLQESGVIVCPPWPNVVSLQPNFHNKLFIVCFDLNLLLQGNLSIFPLCCTSFATFIILLWLFKVLTQPKVWKPLKGRDCAFSISVSQHLALFPLPSTKNRGCIQQCLFTECVNPS